MIATSRSRRGSREVDLAHSAGAERLLVLIPTTAPACLAGRDDGLLWVYRYGVLRKVGTSSSLGLRPEAYRARRWHPFLARPNAHADPLCIVVARPSKLAVLALRFHRRLGVEKRNSKSSGNRSRYLSCRASSPINLGTAHPARRLDSSGDLRILSSCRRLRHVHHTPSVIVESENETYGALLLQGRKRVWETGVER